jgi:rhamnosyltransferase
VRAQREVGEVDLVVLDSESRDGTAEFARAAGARVRRVLRAAFDHGHTRNAGAALARGRFVAFLTQDALPADEHWLVALVDALETESAVGAYGRVLPRPGCSPLVERSVKADLVFSPRREVKRLGPEGLAALAPFARRVRCHFNNVSSCVRRAFFARVPFPVIPFGEDLAWGARVLSMGEAIVYEPRSRVLHSHESGIGEDHARHRADARLMKTLFGIRNRDGWRDGLAGWRLEVRRDLAHVAAAPLPWLEKLKHFACSPFLRAAQITGQLAGTRAPALAPPWFPDALPGMERTDRRATATIAGTESEDGAQGAPSYLTPSGARPSRPDA